MPDIPFQSEIQLQAECWQYVWMKYPETRRLIYAVPNGGKRGKVEAMQLKASGVVPGIPDLVMHWKKKSYGIEMKIPGGRLSDEQNKVHEAWKDHVEAVYTCWSFAEFEEVINKILTS